MWRCAAASGGGRCRSDAEAVKKGVHQSVIKTRRRDGVVATATAAVAAAEVAHQGISRPCGVATKNSESRQMPSRASQKFVGCQCG